MILSRNDIEDLAHATLCDFREKTGNFDACIDIEEFATQYLKLNLRFENLSDEKKLYGLTAYEDTKLRVIADGEEKIIEIKQHQIILDNSFIENENATELLPKMRFTLAHEAAHQLLFALESIKERQKHKKSYSARTAHTYRELKTFEDWNEWQANTLGAAILMPRDIILDIFENDGITEKIVSYGGILSNANAEIITNLCELFNVSKSAVIIRLKTLGFLEQKSFSDYRHPLEVWNDEAI